MATKSKKELPYYSYYGISNYVDQDFDSGTILDYDCSQRTYDTHKGADIFTWPFSWYIYENELVEVVAAASGTIFQKIDGNFDQNCTWENTGNWNAIYIVHDDGSFAYYGHLKEGSLTDLEINSRVETGDYLGVVASSCRSTGPHLHFEVWDVVDGNNQLIDPYAGPCNPLNYETWWADQKLYFEPTLNSILTHNDKPVQGCPAINEKIHLQDYFYYGDKMYFSVAFHDRQANSSSLIKVIKPNGEIEKEFYNTANNTYVASWNYYRVDLIENDPAGEWKIEGEFDGKIYEKSFFYNITNSIDLKRALQVYPNPAINNINIELDERIELNARSLEIIDIQGKSILNRPISNTNTLNINIDLESGTYFLKLLDKNYNVIGLKQFVVI